MLRQARIDRGILVVIPALNEQGSIGGVVLSARRAVPHADVVVVDDGSHDGTSSAAVASGASVLPLPYNIGVGGAVRTGLVYAARAGYRTVVRVDGDGQHDPSDIPRLVEALSRADVVVGSRFADGSGYAAGSSRRLAMRVLARSVSRLCGTRLTDVTSGFSAFGPRGIALFAKHLPADYLADTVDALCIAHREGLTISEVGVDMRARAHGTASQNLIRSVAHLAQAFLSVGLARVRPPVSDGLAKAGAAS